MSSKDGYVADLDQDEDIGPDWLLAIAISINLWIIIYKMFVYFY